jgi:hypothetical protein
MLVIILKNKKVVTLSKEYLTQCISIDNFNRFGKDIIKFKDVKEIIDIGEVREFMLSHKELFLKMIDEHKRGIKNEK